MAANKKSNRAYHMGLSVYETARKSSFRAVIIHDSYLLWIKRFTGADAFDKAKTEGMAQLSELALIHSPGVGVEEDWTDDEVKDGTDIVWASDIFELVKRADEYGDQAAMERLESMALEIDYGAAEVKNATTWDEVGQMIIEAERQRRALRAATFVQTIGVGIGRS